MNRSARHKGKVLQPPAFRVHGRVTGCGVSRMRRVKELSKTSRRAIQGLINYLHQRTRDFKSSAHLLRFAWCIVDPSSVILPALDISFMFSLV